MTLKMTQLTAAILATMASTAYADPQKFHFDIPAQPLSSALQTLSAQSGAPLLYAEQTATGKQSRRLVGDYTTAEAADKLLADSGLVHSVAANGTVTVKQPEVNTLSTVNVTGKAGQNANDPYNKDYYLTNASSATKTDTLIMQTPMSIQVVPRTVLDDQQAISVEDALKNVTGVQAFQGYYVSPMIRGFSGDSSTFRNGLRQEAISFLETANLSSIEVVKGATGLYGRLPVGGLVDNITKRPLEDAYYSVQQQFGSYSLYRTTVDASGPILKDKSLLYRTNFAYSSNNSFRDFVSNDHVFVSPSLTWRPNDKFEANANGEYQHDTFTSDNGLIALGNKPINLPISRYLEDGTFVQTNPSTQDRKLASFDWNYKFNPNWKLTNRFKYDDTDYYQPSLNPLTLVNNNTLTLGLSLANQNRTSYATNLDLTGTFDTGLFHHDLLLGYDFYHFVSNVAPYHAGATPLAPNINLYNPYQTQINISAATINNSFKSLSQWNGVYVQDQITLWDKLHAMMGLRWDGASYGSASGAGKPLDSFNIPTVDVSTVKPRFGLVYQPWTWMSLYGNYIESLGIATAVSANGQAFAPQIGTQYEVGIKNEFFDKRLMTTLAFFDIAKTNVVTPDLAHPGFSLAVGEQRNQGMEYTVQGDITKNINLMAGYSYIDARISKANDGTQGNIFPNVAQNSGNIWGKYSFDDNLLRGVSLGTGVYIQGIRQGNTANTFQLPGYARWDASAAYSFKPFNNSGGKVTTQLNVYNILNQTYYTTSNSALSINPGAPLTVMGSVRVEF